MALVELVRMRQRRRGRELLAGGRLESAGVPAVCFDAGQHAERRGFAIPVIRVMVLDEDLADARALMASSGSPRCG